MKPRLLIIHPSYYCSKAKRVPFRVRRRSVLPLTLPYLAALTPPEWDVALLDEQLEPVRFDEPCDIVALSVMTLNSLRAYDIADEFRRRGVPVLLGGPHTFFHSEEAAAHADAVGVGEAEPIWAGMLQDALDRRLKKIYRAPFLAKLDRLPKPRYELLNLRHYGPFKTYAVVSSRGCPFRCEFCSERLLSGEDYRCRPIADVIDEIKHTGSKNIFFGDSNFGGNRNHAMELMEALIALRLRWSALWNTFLCNDEPFMDLAQRSGLLHVNIGMESINPKTLAGMNKNFNKAAQYGQWLAQLRRRGISYSLNFIFGWDGETEDSFDATLQFVRQHKVPVAYFNILTPVKGTVLYERMQREKRILDETQIDRWPGQICHIRPPFGTPQSMEDNVRRLYREFYSLPSMLHRLPMPKSQSDMASWVINFSQRRMARNEENNFDGF